MDVRIWIFTSLYKAVELLKGKRQTSCDVFVWLRLCVRVNYVCMRCCSVDEWQAECGKMKLFQSTWCLHGNNMILHFRSLKFTWTPNIGLVSMIIDVIAPKYKIQSNKFFALQKSCVESQFLLHKSQADQNEPLCERVRCSCVWVKYVLVCRIISKGKLTLTQSCGNYAVKNNSITQQRG